MKTAIIRSLGVSALATCLAGAPPALAQTSEPVEALPPSGSIPATLLGAPCKVQAMDGRQIQLIRLCFGTPVGEKPTVSFMILTTDKPVSKEEQIRDNRDAMHERQILYAQEVDFNPPNMPGSVGVRAVYKTDMGARIIWSVYHDGKWYKAIVFAFSNFDATAAQAEVEAKFFGIGKP